MVFCSFLTFSSYYTVKAWVCLFGTRSGSCLVDEEVMEEEGRKSRPCPWRIDVMVGLLKEAWAVPWGQLVLEWRLGCPPQECLQDSWMKDSWSLTHLGPGSGEKGTVGPSSLISACRAPHFPHGRVLTPGAGRCTSLPWRQTALERWPLLW